MDDVAVDEVEREITYGRSPDSLRVFVSSQMTSNVLDRERRAAADTINESPIHHAWCWEDHAAAGANHSEDECVRYAQTSDGIVLLLASTLTRVTRAEYEAARQSGADRFVFLRQPDVLDEDAKEFVQQERAAATVTRNFQNISELKTHLTKALLQSAVRASRQRQIQRRSVEVGSRTTIPVAPAQR